MSPRTAGLIAGRGEAHPRARFIGWMRVVFGFMVLFTHPRLDAAAAPGTPNWIWHDPSQAVPGKPDEAFLRTTFVLTSKPASAVLSVAGDDLAAGFINGQLIMRTPNRGLGAFADVTPLLKEGTNLIALRAINREGNPGAVASLQIEAGNGATTRVVTDSTWAGYAREFVGWNRDVLAPPGALPVVALRPLGQGEFPSALEPPTASKPDQLKVLPGFKVELLRSATVSEGSWICMAVDHKQRLILSPQEDQFSLIRITLSASGAVEKTERIPAPVRQAMGLLYAHDSLYVNGHGPQGTGLYRLIDKNRNDQFEPGEVQLLKNFKGEGEHGYHALVLGPDRQIYILNGNATSLPDGLAPTSPHRHYGEDLLLPRQWDAGGHAVGITAPAGHILRTDPEGRTWELLVGGLRNAYDFDFGPDGELFTFDSDMEWDWGLPWYRPNRILHAVSGADFGWRSGTGIWPTDYPDTLPSTVDVGLGSPSGLVFGTGTRFPPRYQRALFALDWAYGRILAVHLTPRGSSYSATFEPVVQGRPLNVSDIVVGPQGALYFITGGRGTTSGLYRLSATSAASPQSTPTPPPDTAAASARELRRSLENFHGKSHSNAVDRCWTHLASEDPFLRSAARIALESQDPATWKQRALAETNTPTAITALLALARVAKPADQDPLLAALLTHWKASLTDQARIDLLRVFAVSTQRQGRPSPASLAPWPARISSLFPSGRSRLDRELFQMLVYLEVPEAVPTGLALMEKASSQEEELFYLFHLRNTRNGWTLKDRQRYFARFNRQPNTGTPPPQLLQWFADVDRTYTDGASLQRYLINIRRDALAALTDAERGELAASIAGVPPPPPSASNVSTRRFVREWTLADFIKDFELPLKGRSFERGKQTYNEAACHACHKLGNEGGAIGPELGAITSKYQRKDLLETILDPSKVIPDPYQNTTFVLGGDDSVTGRVEQETPTTLTIVRNPLTGAKSEIQKRAIIGKRPSTVSPMPSGLLNGFTREEILDLLAYLESGGKPDHPVFR